MSKINDRKMESQANLFGLLKTYIWFILVLTLFSLLAGGLSLLLPKIIANGIDAFGVGVFDTRRFILLFSSVSVAVFVFSYLQSVTGTYTAERVARDLRAKLAAKISRLQFADVVEVTASKLLTNLTSDIDAVKVYISQAVANVVSSIFLIFGSGIILLLIDWKLALVVLTVIPVIAIMFSIIFSRVRVLFKKTREVIDWLNKIINESILGAALIRVLNSQQPEYQKFVAANLEAKSLGMSILKLFASMLPLISFISNLALLAILLLGGHFVINNEMTLGNFSAFINYLGIFIFPIILIGFMSNAIASASAAYQRVGEVLARPEREDQGTIDTTIKGEIVLENVTLKFGEKVPLKNISLKIIGGSKTAIIGPTAAGKTQLLYLLTGLITPSEGAIIFDGVNISKYRRDALHRQIGFVFQDSIVFNISIRENIAFNTHVTEENLQKAIASAELSDFINTLPSGLESVVSERGGNLSGGQKQRIMLARALALNPKILLLDDFTARVDNNTEAKILANIERNYPTMTIVSVTQKISAIEHYDQIILLMEGEILARGKHNELLVTSPEYAQIANSQRSTNHYEL